MLKPGPHHPGAASADQATPAARPRGFTLIELLATLAAMATLLVLATPALSAWLANAKARSSAEQLQNSLRLAQSEALRRNRQTVLALTNATPALAATPVANGRNWFVRALPGLSGETANDGFYVQGVALPSGMRVSITGPGVLCFNTIGRPVTNGSTGLGVNCTAPTNATTPATYDLTVAGATRRLRVQVFLGGQIRLCDRDKTLSSSVPDGC